MFKEYLEVVQKCWEEGNLNYSGEYVNIEDIWVIPEADTEAGAAYLYRGQHEPGERGLRGQPGHSHTGGRSDDDAGTDSARGADVA